MTDQEYLERRKPTAESFDGDDGDKPITKKDLKIFWLEIKAMFVSMESSMLKRSDIDNMMELEIKNHKAECELCKGDYLMKNDCQDVWERCYKIHKEDQAKLTDEKIKNINKYLELGKKAVWMLIPLFAYLTGKNADSLMKLFE